MFNLLPENLKKQITKEYKLRLFIVAMFSLIIVQASFLVFLFPSWLVSNYKEKDFSSRNDEVNKSLSALDISSTTAFIKSLNARLVVINDGLEYPRLVPVVDTILSKKTPSIKIGAVYYTSNSATTGTLTVSGVSSTREALVSFADKIKEVEYLKKVDLPISNLAKDKNIEFSINMNIEK